MSEFYRRFEEVLSQYLEDCELGILLLSEAKEKAIRATFTVVADAVEKDIPYQGKQQGYAIMFYGICREVSEWLRTQAEGKE